MWSERRQPSGFFPVLPVLEYLGELATQGTRETLRGAALVGAQHLLLSTGSLIEALLTLGLQPERVFLLGKCYSQNQEVIDRLDRMGIHVVPGSEPGSSDTFGTTIDRDARRLWDDLRGRVDSSNIEALIVLDDGGHCLDTMPPDLRQRFRVVGIEQTTSGIRRRPTLHDPPVISVASCAAKRYFEPRLISKIVLRRLGRFLRLGRRSIAIGVVGLGPIGRALARDIVTTGQPVFVYDREFSSETQVAGVTWCDGIEELLDRVDILLGCTGEDIFNKCNWQTLAPGTKIMGSCSSEDREFASLLRLPGIRNRTDSDERADLSITVGPLSCRVLRGGYPINFDGSLESVPTQEIQLTRSLLMAGVLQASVMSTRSVNSQHVMLDPTLQACVVHKWLESPACRDLYPPSLLEAAREPAWFGESSAGMPALQAAPILNDYR